jgi:polysaccharide pyruvyl transferase WcaK-like protein
LLEKYFDQVEVFSGLIHAYSTELSFVLVPNDSRSARSDAAIGSDLHESLDENANVFLLKEPLSPGALMTLASRALAAISGRMHLTILCANAGTPTLAISYQGKIEGLYQRLRSDYFLDPTSAQFAESLGQKFSEFLSNTEALSKRLRGSHAELRELARLNVSGLDEAP